MSVAKLQREPVVGTSGDVVETQVAKLKALFPECVTEGNVDFDKLRSTLGAAVESGPGRFTFSWAGKDDAVGLLQTPSRGTLIPCPNESINFNATGNAFIEGDNLEVLKLLFKPYFGRVKLIYIDPPYNTGQDFVYPDNFTDPLKNYLIQTEQIDDDGNLATSKIDRTGRIHSSWLSMMYPRLFLARQLLKEEGLICVSIDDNEVHHLRMLLNEVFGEENFISQITIESNSRGRQSDRFVAGVHEYLLIYGKDVEATELAGAELGAKQLADYKHTTDDGRKYRLRGLRHRGNASRRVDRPQMYFPLYVDPTTRSVSVERTEAHTVEVFPRKSTGEDGRWEWGPAKAAKDIHLLEGVLVTTRDEWDISQREFLEVDGEARRQKWRTIWDEKEIDYQNGKRDLQALFDSCPFDYPKPVSLLRKIVDGATVGNDIVLDFFAGSCPTAQAVLEANRDDEGRRQFIAVQLPEPVAGQAYPTIAAMGLERIRRVIRKLEADAKVQLSFSSGENPEDLGVKVFKLATPNIEQWVPDNNRDPEKYAGKLHRFDDPLVGDWKPENVLWEVALREGFGLNTRYVTKTLANGTNLYEVTDPDKDPPQTFLLCLDEEVRADMSKHHALTTDMLFICRDKALDDTAAANLALQCRLKTI